MGCVAPRRDKVSIPTGAGQSNTIKFGDTQPELSGWVVSFRVTGQASGVFPTFIIHARDNFLGTATVEFGDSSAGVSCNQGGRLWIPYPSADLEFYDRAGSGGASPVVHTVARAVMLGQFPGASSTCKGISAADVAAGGDNDFDVPAGAQEYWVGRPNDGDEQTVEAIDGEGNSVEIYNFSADDLPYTQTNPSPWRETPPWDGNTASKINVALGAGVAANNQVEVHWRFNLGGLR